MTFKDLENVLIQNRRRRLESTNNNNSNQYWKGKQVIPVRQMVENNKGKYYE